MMTFGAAADTEYPGEIIARLLRPLSSTIEVILQQTMADKRYVVDETARGARNRGA